MRMENVYHIKQYDHEGNIIQAQIQLLHHLIEDYGHSDSKYEGGRGLEPTLNASFNVKCGWVLGR